jgi:hypothetical protein
MILYTWGQNMCLKPWTFASPRLLYEHPKSVFQTAHSTPCVLYLRTNQISMASANRLHHLHRTIKAKWLVFHFTLWGLNENSEQIVLEHTGSYNSEILVQLCTVMCLYVQAPKQTTWFIDDNKVARWCAVRTYSAGFLEDLLVESGETVAGLCPKLVRGHGIEFLECGCLVRKCAGTTSGILYLWSLEYVSTRQYVPVCIGMYARGDKAVRETSKCYKLVRTDINKVISISVRTGMH